AAIEAMQSAANRLVQQRSTNFELWDNLAELYCAQADRERNPVRARAARANGVAMLREFRCAINLWRWTPEHGKCALPNWRNEAPSLQGEPSNVVPWGFVPNPDLTPLCYAVLCAPGFQHDSAERRGEEFENESMEFGFDSAAHWFKQDAENLPRLEKA